MLTKYQIQLIFRFLVYMGTRRTTPGEISKEAYEFDLKVMADIRREAGLDESR